MNRTTGIIGCANGAIAIALGAFGAHALKQTLENADTLYVWQTAVDYQMWHAVALFVCAIMPNIGSLKTTATLLFCFGIIFFSGSLYWLALGGPRWLGPVTPIGGLAFLFGWLALAGAFIKDRDKAA